MLRRLWLIAALLGACDSAKTNQLFPGSPCMPQDTCESSTCVGGFCVAESCQDADGDGAGSGPGCTTFDCDDTDPTVPSGNETCNDQDDDCDGAIDEACPCLDGAGSPLPDGSSRACGMGECAGVQTCQAGVWSGCAGGAAPAPNETCFNDRDDNCDGSIDEGCCPTDEQYCPGIAVCSSNGVCG